MIKTKRLTSNQYTKLSDNDGIHEGIYKSATFFFSYIPTIDPNIIRLNLFCGYAFIKDTGKQYDFAVDVIDNSDVAIDRLIKSIAMEYIDSLN